MAGINFKENEYYSDKAFILPITKQLCIRYEMILRRAILNEMSNLRIAADNGRANKTPIKKAVGGVYSVWLDVKKSMTERLNSSNSSMKKP